MIDLLSDNEKENRDAAKSLPVIAASVVPEPRDAEENLRKSTEATMSTVPSKEFPSTPAAKLALPDLIGMGDVRRTIHDISPEDRLEWDQKMDGIPKTKKRARSSSPISSPAARTPGPLNKKAESLLLPADPGSELWGRYSLNGSNAPTPQGLAIPALAHLMCTSSPQPAREETTPRSTGVFRRANSCGNQFPKRRRIGGPADDDIFTESAGIGQSRLSVMIERLQEGLGPRNLPSESELLDFSTVTVKSRVRDDRHCTSIQSVQQDLSKGTEASNQPLVSEIIPALEEIQNLPPVRSDGSDYGEFDDNELDDEALLKVITKSGVSQSTPSHAPKPIVPPDPPPEVLGSSVRVESLLVLSQHESQSPECSTLRVNNDEFDDSDEDLFTIDLEDIVAKFDDYHPSGAKLASVEKPRDGMAVKDTDSEDEFGDGSLDDVDFEVAEAAATQSIQQTANSLLTVRTKFS